MSIRTNRVKQRLAASQVATILGGTNDPDLIDQLGPLGADGIWLEGEHGVSTMPSFPLRATPGRTP
jgi:hypothetical protein